MDQPAKNHQQIADSNRNLFDHKLIHKLNSCLFRAMIQVNDNTKIVIIITDQILILNYGPKNITNTADNVVISYYYKIVRRYALQCIGSKTNETDKHACGDLLSNDTCPKCKLKSQIEESLSL